MKTRISFNKLDINGLIQFRFQKKLYFLKAFLLVDGWIWVLFCKIKLKNGVSIQIHSKSIHHYHTHLENPSSIFSFSPFKAFREVTGSQMPTEGTLIILHRNSAVLVNYSSLIIFFFAFCSGAGSFIFLQGRENLQHSFISMQNSPFENILHVCVCACLVSN